MIEWNHHPDGNSGVARSTLHRDRAEGYYCLHNGVWYCSIFDCQRTNLTFKWARSIVDEKSSRKIAIEWIEAVLYQ